jgi:hypothetical protein
MLKIILLTFTTLFISACGTKTYRFTGTEIIEDKMVKIHSPLGKFLSTSDKLSISARGYDGGISFYKRDMPGGSYNIDFDSFDESYIDAVKRYDYLFNPQLDWEEYEKELHEEEKIWLKDGRIQGHRLQKVYLNNLACGLVSYSRSPFDYMASSANKSYSLEFA